MSTLNAQDIVEYLQAHPEFLDAHPELLATLTVPHPQNGQAVSLVERQAQVQRQRIQTLEGHIAELKRHGVDNDALVDKLIVWARALLAQPEAAALPDTAVEQMKQIFGVPYAALRLWAVAPGYEDYEWAAPVNDDIKRLVKSMRAPFAGANAGFEAAIWMHPNVATIRSLALMPLRLDADPDSDPFGLLVLGSNERERFQVTMGTEFLSRFALLAAAALARLLPAQVAVPVQATA